MLCHGQSNGHATVTTIGGTPSYTYQWDSGQNTQTATNLSAGTHIVTVTDHNGCTDTTSVTITQPTQLGIILTADSVKCYGRATGGITAIDTGGTPTYHYLWSSVPPQTGQNLINVKAGVYTVTLTDHNGCTDAAAL